MEALNIEIQPCKKSQLNELLKIATAAYNDNYQHIWEDGGLKYVKHNFSESVLSEELSDPQSRFYLLKTPAETVGFAKVVVDKPYDDFSERAALYLHRLYLRKHATGKGIGSFFMDFLKKEALLGHKEIIWLQAMPSTLSVKFYLRHGYEIVKKGFIPFPGIKDEFADLYDMVLPLS